MKVVVAQRCLTVCDPMDCDPRLLSPWDSPGKNTGVGSHSLLQGLFLTQELNPGLLHCRQILYHLSEPPGKLSIWVDDLICAASLRLWTQPLTIPINSRAKSFLGKARWPAEGKWKGFGPDPERKIYLTVAELAKILEGEVMKLLYILIVMVVT